MSNSDIVIRKLDESYVIIDCVDEAIQADLNSFFTMYAVNYQFHPAYKRRKWDGKMRLYSTATHKLPAGLLRYVLAFSEERKLKVEVQDNLDVLNNFSISEATRFFAALNPQSDGKPITAHEHQVLGLAKGIRYKRALLISPTSSGKSLMAYAFIRYFLQSKGGGCKRGLLVVPTVNLVEQMYKDFQDYVTTADANGTPEYSLWGVEARCQKIYEGYTTVIEPSTGVVISTWQSIYEQPPEWFEQFDFVIGDEAHGFKAESLKTIMASLVNARYRIGMTGTLDGTKIHRMVIEGHFGPCMKLISTKEMQDKGLAAQLKIKGLILKHKPEDAKQLAMDVAAIKEPKKKWKHEMDVLIGHQKRNNFIKNLTLSLKGNRLVLFNYLEHGQILMDLMSGHDRVFLVNGGTKVEQRERVRALAEKYDNVVIIASYGTYSTGVNIKNLQHIIFASPSKSKIRVLQSIGRGLRLKVGKLFVTLYDITDDLRDDDWINITLVQYVRYRLAYYKEEGWKVSSYIIDL